MHYTRPVTTTKSDMYHEKDVHVILNSLKDIATSVMFAAEGARLETVLERIAAVSRDLVSARYAALGVPDGRGGLRFFKVSGMTQEEIDHIGHLPSGRGLLGTIMHERKTIRIANMQDDARSAGFCVGHPHMASLLGVPVQVGTQLYGMLYLSDRVDGQPFSEQDEWLVETMAGYAALAIAGAQLSEQQGRLQILEERERSGMDLHDGIIQSLYAIGMHLDLMRQIGPVKAEELHGTIDNLNSVIEDIRRYIMDLKAPSYKTLYECFNDMVHRLHVPPSIHVEINAPHHQPPFLPSTFEAISQIAFEALSNAVRHAHADHIRISTVQDQNRFQVRIADDGRGFELDAALARDGLGLRNIAQRAQLYGGQVDIKTAPGEGTVLTVTLPVSTK